MRQWGQSIGLVGDSCFGSLRCAPSRRGEVVDREYSQEEHGAIPPHTSHGIVSMHKRLYKHPRIHNPPSSIYMDIHRSSHMVI